MHKGYTLNYFIEFFKNIPDHRWTVNRLRKGSTLQCCALGHAGGAVKLDYETTYVAELPAQERIDALNAFLGGKVSEINDGRGRFAKLGRTPRGRILKALRLRKARKLSL